MPASPGQLEGQLPTCGPPSSTGPSSVLLPSSPPPSVVIPPLLPPLLLAPPLLPPLLPPELPPLLPELPPLLLPLFLLSLSLEQAPIEEPATIEAMDRANRTFIDFMDKPPARKTRRNLSSRYAQKVSHHRHG